ncbi:MAG: hypothetical protein U5N27_19925 [Rhizobium sp.]|nr:hypothetical protein [Rhizobium sp.]
MGGVWLSCQLWDHCVYAGQPTALVERVYPILRGAAEFLLDFLTELPGTDALVTVPTNSPENIHPFGVSLSVGAAMDNQLGRDLFDAILAAGIETDTAFFSEQGAGLPEHGSSPTASATPDSSRSGSKTGTWKYRRWTIVTSLTFTRSIRALR